MVADFGCVGAQFAIDARQFILTGTRRLTSMSVRGDGPTNYWRPEGGCGRKARFRGAGGIVGFQEENPTAPWPEASRVVFRQISRRCGRLARNGHIGGAARRWPRIAGALVSNLRLMRGSLY